MSSDLDLAAALRQQRPQPLLVTPIFDFGVDPLRWTGLWQDEDGRRYEYSELPPETILRVVSLDDEHRSGLAAD